MEVKNFKQLVNEHIQRSKLERPAYICTPDKENLPNGYFCTLKIGEQTFCTPNWQKTKKGAEIEAAKIACDKLSLKKISAELKAEREAERAEKAAETVLKPASNGTHAPPPVRQKQPGGVKEADWITIEKVEDIYQYLTDEVLAQEFKAFLHCKAQEQKKDYPVFTTEDAGEKGFKSTLTYDGKAYTCLGVMMSKKQAEQSAAEVCLRSLGDFPNVAKDKYTIQMYRGGQVHIPEKKKEQGTRYLISYLTGFVGCLGHQFPTFVIKETGTEVKSYEVICTFEGKTFPSESFDMLIDAKCNAAQKGLEYFGFNAATAKEAHELRDVLRIKKRRYHVPLGPLVSPLHHAPSRYTRWISYHFESNDVITGESKTVKDCEHMFDTRKIVSIGEDKVMEMLLGKPPVLDWKPLRACTDISICEIDSDNKNIVTIGNNKASYKMFCQDGKIRCNNRSCDVELLAGHSIRGLNCSYHLMLPSQQIYLKAESCDDLTYPNPPLPVVTSCGMVVMLHDHETTSTQEIQILLTRPSSVNPFATKARFLASYLNKVISGHESQSRFNVAQCTANIETWPLKEINLLTEMTMDSLHELMSPYVRYDDRWNEIFAKDLPDVLKELETACAGEITRRTEEGVEEEAEEAKGPWELPTSRFRHRAMPVGLVIESQTMCVYRALLETTGLKVKLADLEATPTVDVPYDGTEKSHRGDVSRYFIWKGLRKVNRGETDPYYTETRAAFGDEWIDEKREDRKAANKNRRMGKPGGFHGKKAKMGNGTKEAEPKVETEEKPAASEEAEQKEVTEEEEPAKQEEEATVEDPVEEEKKPGVFVAGANRPHRDLTERDSKSVQDECQWFPLDEAKTLCPMLLKISTAADFMNQVQSLQTEADTFLKEKEANST